MLRPAPLAFLVVAALALACGGRDEDDDDEAAQAVLPRRLEADGSVTLSAEDREALGLQTAPAAEGDVPDVQIRYGTVSGAPGSEGWVVSPVDGLVLSAVAPGASVRAGEAVATVQPRLAAADRVAVGVQSSEVESRIGTAKADLAQREAALERVRKLAADGIASQARLQEAEADVARSRAELDAMTRARGATGDVVVTAPVEGVLADLDAAEGVPVAAGAVLGHVVAGGPRRVDLAVPPDDPAPTGFEVHVGDAWVPATLVARGGVVEADGAVHDVLEVDAPALLPGATVDVRVASGGAHGVVVPESALVSGAEGDAVWVELAEGRYASKPVDVLARFGGQVRVEGIDAGTPVVTVGAMSLRGEALRAALGEVE